MFTAYFEPRMFPVRPCLANFEVDKQKREREWREIQTGERKTDRQRQRDRERQRVSERERERELFNTCKLSLH